MKWTLLISALFVMNCAGSLAVSSSAGDHKSEIPQMLPYPEYMQNFYLENGLEVLAIRNSASPMVCLNMTIRVGSAYEDYHTSGMSHMLEHLLFNGTENRTQAELYDETDFLGAYSNAFTDRYFTDFILLLPKEYLTNGMDIQSDMLFHSTLPAEKLEKERGIVMEEIRKDRDRESYEVNNAFNRMNYGNSGKGLPTLGTLSTIEHMKRQDILDFYHRHYVPNNMILTVIGNFDPSTLRQALEEYYGDEPPGILTGSPVPHDEIVTGGENTNINQVVMEVKSTYVELVYDFSPVNYFSSSHAYDRELTNYAAEMIFGWLQEDLSQKFPVYDVSVSLRSEPEFTGITVDFTLDDPDVLYRVSNDIQNRIFEFMQGLSKTLTEEKISFWVKNQLVEEVSFLDQPHYYGMMKAHVLATAGGSGVIRRNQILPKIELDDILSRVPRLELNLRKMNIVLPATVSDKTDSGSDVVYERSVLPSGAVLVTATGGESEMMGMHILVKNRSVIEGRLTGGAEILHSLLDSGTDQYTREEISSRLSQLGANTKFMDLSYIPYDDYYNSPDYGYIRLECLDSDAQEAIRLITHLMEKTELTQEKLTSAIEQAMKRVMMQQSTARQKARLEFNKMFLGAGHPSTRNVSGGAATISQINLDNLTDLRDRYFDPSNYVITISSRLPHDTYVELFNAIWQTPGSPTDRVKFRVRQDSEHQKKIIELGKEQAQIIMGYKFSVEKSDLPAISLLTDIASYRMMFDLREKQGLAYTLGMSAGNEGDLAWIIASIGTGTDNIHRAVEGMKSYFDASVAAGDLTDEEVQKTVNAGKGRYLRRNLTRIGQAFYMGYYEFYYEDYSLAKRRYEVMDTITSREIQRVAQKYLELPGNYTLLIVK